MKRALPRPPRFVLPSTGQSPRERKKIRCTSRATSEITITRPLLHKTRPRPSLARFSNQRNSSCPPLPRSRKHSCAPPIVQSWHARGSSCNPFHRDFFLLSFFLPFFACFGEKIFRITHPQFCIPLRVTPSVQSGSREGEVKLEYRGRFDQTIFLIFSASIIIAQCCVYYGDHNGEKNYCGISWKKYMINYRFPKI